MRRWLLAATTAAVVAATGASADPHDWYATVHGLEGTGSSFMLAPGLAATNAHVVAGQIPGDTVTVVAAGTETQATIVAISSRVDLALLRVPRDLMPVVHQSSSSASRNDALTAVGAGAVARGRVINPDHTLEPYGRGLTAVLRGARRGFSGGPVFDGSGRLAGMLSAVYLRRNSHAFLISAETIRAESCRMVASVCSHF